MDLCVVTAVFAASPSVMCVPARRASNCLTDIAKRYIGKTSTNYVSQRCEFNGCARRSILAVVECVMVDEEKWWREESSYGSQQST